MSNQTLRQTEKKGEQRCHRQNHVERKKIVLYGYEYYITSMASPSHTIEEIAIHSE